jgi:hypothetical protein
MKRILLVTSLIIASITSFSQFGTMKENSWKVKWNKKLVLSANGENEARNAITIAKADLSKKCFLEIQFKEADSEKANGWKRTFLIMDENDNELARIEKGSTITVKAADLKKHFKGRNCLRIFSISLPKDPELAARVRVRRIHIVTVKLA